MRILHLGNLAGWPAVLAKKQRALGHNAENVIHEYRDVKGLDRKLPYDRAIFKSSDNKLIKVFKTLEFLFFEAPKYDIIHYHSSCILPRELYLAEGLFLKAFGVKTVITFGGGDARIVSEARRLNKFFYRKSSALRDAIIKWRWVGWNRLINISLSDPELNASQYNKIKQKEVFAQPFDFDRISTKSKRADKLVFMHIPTEPWVKGTNIIDQVMSEICAKKDVEYVRMHNLEQSEFYRQLSKCDVYIDELKCGSHGMTAVEAMAMGKVVISYIRDDLIRKYPPDLPIFSCDPETFEDRIWMLVNDVDLIRQLQAASRAYAKKYHDAEKVAANCIDIYRSKLTNV